MAATLESSADRVSASPAKVKLDYLVVSTANLRAFSITYLPHSYPFYRGSQRSSQPEMGGGVQYYMNPLNPSTPPPRPENTSVKETRFYTATVGGASLQLHPPHPQLLETGTPIHKETMPQLVHTVPQLLSNTPFVGGKVVKL